LSGGDLARARVLVVGVGGLGCPAALALGLAGVGHLGLADDDVVERTNLHRQILFDDADVGTPKLDAAARALTAAAPGLTIELHRERLTPASAARLVRQYDLVVEGSDNFATKFLAADACVLAGVPVVHAAAIRWVGTVMAVAAKARPCYRCVFEDVPTEDAPNCSEAGVMGPVVGVVAAIQADLALSLLAGGPRGANVEGQLVSFDGRTDALRRRRVRARSGCPLCGAAPSIQGIEPRAYETPACAG
jgi:molybdopterin/thiamine biosynthesis adenylyltransferase